MPILYRSLVCAVLGALLILAMHQAVRHGRAGEQFYDHARAVWTLRKQSGVSGQYPSAATLAEMESDSAAALARVPTHGAQWLNQLLIARTLRQSPGGAIAENLPLAESAARSALVRMPQSPVAWAEYALVLDVLNSQNQLKGGTAEVQAAIRRALALGPHETNMMLVMIDLGLRNWDELLPETRAALSRATATLAPRHRDTLWQIALRRGRMAELCADAAMRAFRGCAPVPAQTEGGTPIQEAGR